MSGPAPPADEFAFQGRTAEEYSQFFDLSPKDWSSILDCGAGPSSFAATVHDETNVVSVDPAYQDSIAKLRDRSETSIKRLNATFPKIKDRFVWSFYDGLDDRLAYLEQAQEQFLDDIVHSPGRYVAAALPSLPFQGNAFELILTAHFLFLYDNQIDKPFLYQALDELCRVARSEVRVYPLMSLSGQPSELVEPAIAWLEEAGHTCELRSVPFEFHRGAEEMLVITPD